MNAQLFAINGIYYLSAEYRIAHNKQGPFSGPCLTHVSGYDVCNQLS